MISIGISRFAWWLEFIGCIWTLRFSNILFKELNFLSITHLSNINTFIWIYFVRDIINRDYLLNWIRYDRGTFTIVRLDECLEFFPRHSEAVIQVFVLFILMVDSVHHKLPSGLWFHSQKTLWSILSWFRFSLQVLLLNLQDWVLSTSGWGAWGSIVEIVLDNILGLIHLVGLIESKIFALRLICVSH